MGRAVGARGVTDAYSRLYHRFSQEFPDIWADDQALASWVRLLALADASWPMRPPLLRSARKRTLDRLVAAGLVMVAGETYTILGLDAERNRRRDAGRTGAAKRWQSDGNAIALPRRDENETSKDKRETPPPPAERGRRANGTNPRASGTDPRSAGANPRANGTSVRQERVAQKRGPTALHGILTRAAQAGSDDA